MTVLRFLGRLIISPIVLVVLGVFGIFMLILAVVVWVGTGNGSKVNLNVGS